MHESDDYKEVGIRTAKRGTIYIATEIATSVISLIILVYLARVLQPDQFGLYAVAIAFSQVLFIFGNFAIGATLRKKIPESLGKKERLRSIVSGAYAVALVAALVVAAIGLILSGWLSTEIYKNTLLVLPIQLASISVIFSVIMNMENSTLIGLGDVKESSIMNFAYTISQIILMVAIVGILDLGIAGAIAGYLISAVIGTVFGAAVHLQEGWQDANHT